MRVPLADSWIRRIALRTIRRFEVRLERFKLVNRRTVRARLLEDPVVLLAARQHSAAHDVPIDQVLRQVQRYIDEIVPFFNVLSYYRLGYTVSRVLLRALYRLTSEYQDRTALNAIPRQDVVVYLMNHRSNADYVVVAYVLAREVSISYAVGEWARTWPLEYIFKSFGAYFVRRRFREPLYHAVLERYIQLITRNGITQGIFLEGRLSRTGALGPAKLGLLDYIVRTLRDPAFDRDIWLVPVALNYDRVLEDRVLTREVLNPDGPRPGRLRQLASVLHYGLYNVARWLTRTLRRYGRVAVNFGTPLSVRSWLGPDIGVLDLPWEARHQRLQTMADEVMSRIEEIMPVTPVPLVAAALLSFEQPVIRRDQLLQRLDEYRDYLLRNNTKLVHADRGVYAILDRASRMLRMRRLAHAEGDSFVILPTQRPLMEYYANSVRHLLPVAHPIPEGELLRHAAIEMGAR
ncbi:MAG: 1-acyl-sn-glycerol-3-phosphate acyltransferase [Gemmatimonadetes bacterium]|nr:1-acyl-sn-glycerol-3-phosphate acyltransferase [Gemmatimonadota bacterium]